MIESNEKLIDLGFVDSSEYEFYSIRQADRMYPTRVNNLVAGYQIQTSADQVHNQRAIYTVLDFLGDVGGLLDGLKLIGASIISLFYGNSLSDFLLSQIFFDRPKQGRDLDQNKTEVAV